PGARRRSGARAACSCSGSSLLVSPSPSRLPRRREPRLSRQLDPAARRPRPVPRPAPRGAAAPARFWQPAALYLLHDLRPEDHAAVATGAPGVRRHRRRRRLHALASLDPEPHRLGALPLRSAHAAPRRAHRNQTGETRMRTAACALAVALTAAAPAHAFCGFFVGKADGQLFNKSSQVAIVRDGNRTVITM